jgi:polysaccharide pyruvyl transferase WcaK-like protein
MSFAYGTWKHDWDQTRIKEAMAKAREREALAAGGVTYLEEQLRKLREHYEVRLAASEQARQELAAELEGLTGSVEEKERLLAEQEAKAREERIELLNAAAFIYTRETKTLSILQSAGVKAEFGPDGCFGIDVRDDERGLATMKKLGLEEKKFITVMIRRNTPKYPGVDDSRPEKLNPLHPTPKQIADDERRAAKFRELVTQWVKKTGHMVLIAPETIKEMGHNKRLIHDPLPPEIQKHVVNLDTFWNADEAASIFARAHTVVCHEPHSPIIALANGTPIIHTYSEFHSPKCWMFKDIGLREWLLEMDETPVEKILETLSGIDADYPAAQAKVKKAMAYVHECFSGSMKHVKGVLG